jgi:hypothetical protein
MSRSCHYEPRLGLTHFIQCNTRKSFQLLILEGPKLATGRHRSGHFQGLFWRRDGEVSCCGMQSRTVSSSSIAVLNVNRSDVVTGWQQRPTVNKSMANCLRGQPKYHRRLAESGKSEGNLFRELSFKQEIVQAPKGAEIVLRITFLVLITPTRGLHFC